MLARISSAQSVVVKGVREMDEAFSPAGTRDTRSRFEIEVQRPGRMYAHLFGGRERVLMVDGETFHWYDGKENLYGSIPAKPGLGETIDMLKERTRLAFPLGELLAGDNVKRAERMAGSWEWLGVERAGLFGKTELAHVKMLAERADVEFWIDRATRLPKRMVVTSTVLEGSPRFSYEFSHWDLRDRAVSGKFTFVPPKGAMEVEPPEDWEFGTGN